MDFVALGVRCFLAAVFAVAAGGKLLDRPAARQALAEFRVPERLLTPVAWLLPTVELLTAALLLFQPTGRYGAVCASILLILFSAGMGSAMARGEAPNCNCFGQIGSSPVGPRTMARNLLLLGPAIFVISVGAGKDLGSWLSARSSAQLVAIGLGCGVAGLTVATIRLARRTRQLRRDLSRAQGSLAVFPPGLPVGARAPSFTLQSTKGGTETLESLLARGRDLALVFISPGCVPCQMMFPDLARWQQTLPDRITIVPIAAASLDEADEMARRFGFGEILVQREAEVFEAYRGSASPAVVIVSRNGLIASRMRSSQGVVEAVIRQALRGADSNPAPASAETEPRELADQALVVSRWAGRSAQPA